MTPRITSARFIKAITDVRQAPPERPAIVFAGRSNVGKSSLINRLTNQRALARTSTTPGRTQEIIYFEMNGGEFYFIDLPGYGYAKVPLKLRLKWGPMIARFFEAAPGLRLVVLIVDVRRDPNTDDFQMLDWLNNAGHPYLIAVTKIDKLGGNERRNRLILLQKALNVAPESIIAVSGRTGAGMPELAEGIFYALSLAPPASAEPAELPNDPESMDS